jgi:hypothetical protein
MREGKMTSTVEDVRRLLELEYQRLQASIDKFDDRLFKIKGWAITVAGALFALGVQGNRPIIIAAGAVVVAFFGFLEVIYVDLLSLTIKRSDDVEALLESARRTGLGAGHEAYVFGLGKIFKGGFQFGRVKALLRKRHHLTAFYAGLVLLMALGAILLAAFR